MNKEDSEPFPATLDHSPGARMSGVATSESSTCSLRLMRDSVLKGLSWLDRFLAPLVLLAMILGVIIGKFAAHVQSVLGKAKFEGVSVSKPWSTGNH